MSFRQQFINYLHTKVLSIDIYSYDSQLYYGTVKIDLHNLLIQEA